MDQTRIPDDLRERIGALLVARFDHHRSHGGAAAEQYRLAKRLQRAQYSLSRPRLYIDTNHWIRLRDVLLGRPRGAADTRLLELLRTITRGRLLTVPLSSHLIQELCYQTDLTTLRATAALMDELSQGVTLAGFRDRTVLELLHWIRAIAERGAPLPVLLVWTTVPNIFQLQFADIGNQDPHLRNSFSNAYEDVAESIRLSDLIGRLAAVTHGADRQLEIDLAVELTRHKETIWATQGGLASVFQEEAVGYLEKVLPYLDGPTSDELRKLPGAAELEGEALVRNAKIAFLAANDLKLAKTALPGLRIMAGCNALIRCDTRRRFKQGDQVDLQHAAAALPYCTAYLTDRPMQHLLTSSPYSLAALYDCEVLSTAEEAIRHLNCLVA